MQSSFPPIDAVKALDQRIFATLTPDEMNVLNFYRDQGRKHGVTIIIDTDANPDDLARASSRERADQILKQANNLVHVTVAD